MTRTPPEAAYSERDDDTPTTPADGLLSVAMVTLGCARNEVDSEELAGRLEADGFRLVDDPTDADTVLVNTCGFVEAAKKDSVDTLLEAADLKATGRPQAVVAVGCLAERYGAELAAVAARGRRGARLRRLPRHRRPAARRSWRGRPTTRTRPQDRRRLLPISPVDRDAARQRARPRASGHEIGVGAPATGPRTVRRRLDGGPMAPLKLASGCDRRCSFCAIPQLPRLVRQPPAQRRARRGPLAGRRGRPRAVPGQRELHVLRQGPRRPAAARDPAARAGRHRRRRAGAGLLPPAGRDPARPDRGDRDARPASRRTSTSPSSTPAPRCCAGCAASATPRASSACSTQVRGLAPEAGVRSNVIVGFPGETEDDLADPVRLPGRRAHGRHRRLRLLRRGRHRGGVVRRQAGRGRGPRARAEHVTALVEELTAQRAEERIGESVEVLVESLEDGERRGPGRPPGPRGRRHHDADRRARGHGGRRPGPRARWPRTDGVDLIATTEVGPMTEPTPARPTGTCPTS